MGFFQTLHQLVSTFRVTDLIDILVIAVIVYYVILLVKETRAEQLIKGFIAILILAQLSDWLDLYTVNWLLSNLLTVGMILVIVVFQPELRRAFERLGRSQGWLLSFVNNDEDKNFHQVDEIVRASLSLSRQKIGALIVLEGDTGLNEIVETGSAIEGLVSSELLINIFIPNTPLHDGAVVIKEDKVRAAGAFLPLTENMGLSRELGTRHRAALGISERSDALIVVVSEETGVISVCRNGKIARRMDESTLREVLTNFYHREPRYNRFLGLLTGDAGQADANQPADKEIKKEEVAASQTKKEESDETTKA